jgi:Tfp pilus assembly protein PilX
MMHPPFPFKQTPHHRRKSGMALIITLSLIVLVTMAAMAFFTRATSNTTIESSRASQVLVKQVADTAADYVAGQFLQEIAINSTATTSNGITIYQPVSASNAVPQRYLAAGTTATTGPVFANLVRQSYNDASSDNTATPSRNGRSISTNRWNTPKLTIGGGFSSTDQTPNWIYLCKDGTVTTNVTPASATNIIGRFAYNAYDIGGLLDANVAGYPSSVTGTNLAAIKGTLAGADLTQLGITSAAANALISFRNPQASASAAAYTNYVQGAAHTGFLNALTSNPPTGGTNTNNFFNSRQDLIRYATTNNTALTNALPYLTHYSRELNAPSWYPTTNTLLNNYASNANTIGSTNRNIPNVRVQTSFTRLDGSTAQVGQPLIKSRFPLSRLCWLQDANLSTGSYEATAQTTNDVALINGARVANGQTSLTTAQMIQQSFGLVWNQSAYCWDYCGATGSIRQTSILTLDAVASAGREPNFFELLKAGILSGSLGLGAPGSGLTLPNLTGGPSLSGPQNSQDFQTFRIGACAIDQVKSDSYPTRIAYNDSLAGTTPWVACGVQRLPYISRWTQVPLRATSAADANNLTLADYQFSIVVVPVLSNPFQGSDLSAAGDANLMPLPLPTQRPNVRIKIQGLCQITDNWQNVPMGALPVIPPKPLTLSTSGRDATNFSQDSYITTADVAAVPTTGSMMPFANTLTMQWEQFMNSSTWNSGYVNSTGNPVNTNTGRGMPVGFRLPPCSPASTNVTPYVYVIYGGTSLAAANTANAFQLSMEFQAPNGSWYPYSMAAGVENDMNTWSTGLYAYAADLMSPGVSRTSTTVTQPSYDAAGWENVPMPWMQMVPYSYDGTGSAGSGGMTNYAFSDFDFVANFCQVIVKADPRSTRFNTVGSNNHNLRGLSNGGRLTRGLWNMSSQYYRNQVTNVTSMQPPAQRAWVQSDAGLAVNESNLGGIVGGTPLPSTPKLLALKPDGTCDGLYGLTFGPNGGLPSTWFYPALLCRNTGANRAMVGPNSLARASYTDPDGVQRVADCGLYPDPPWNSTVPTAGNPFLPSSPSTLPAGNNPDRPIILNRPFRSVAELGYVFRDQPFKTLDFFSTASADAALLDLFCVSENITGVRAGVINLNTQNPSVMAALFSGAVTREQVTPVTLAAAIPAALATNLISYITNAATGPFLNKADLAPFIATQTNSMGNVYNKAALESIARSLADAGQTRTWNLLVDLVAQSGSFPKGQTGAGSFIVQGEKSVWNSLAIDRPQAKIIDQQSENAIQY